jgi:hypothetical protein
VTIAGGIDDGPHRVRDVQPLLPEGASRPADEAHRAIRSGKPEGSVIDASSVLQMADDPGDPGLVGAASVQSVLHALTLLLRAESAVTSSSDVPHPTPAGMTLHVMPVLASRHIGDGHSCGRRSGA